MKTVFVILFLILLSKWSNSQNNNSNLSDSTSNVIKLLSYFWIKDSLANNGFRLYSYDHILKSKIDRVTSDSLVKRLGKPNETRNTNQGFQLWYYVYDSKAMPKEFGRPFECLAILTFVGVPFSIILMNQFGRSSRRRLVSNQRQQILQKLCLFS